MTTTHITTTTTTKSVGSTGNTSWTGEVTCSCGWATHIVMPSRLQARYHIWAVTQPHLQAGS